MDARKATGNRNASVASNAQREAWLLGQPPLRRYLNFVEDHVVGGDALRKSDLVDEWRRANDYYYDLEIKEAGIADEIDVRPLPAPLKKLARRVEDDPRYIRSYDDLPTRIAMVELARLVVPQPHVNLDHVKRQQARFPAKGPTPEELFRFCLPLDRAEAPVKVRRMGSGKYQFWSQSSDFRFLEPKLQGGADLDGVESFGPISNALSLLVGYGSNFLTLIESDTRLLLHNGHHRAVALLDAGVTHAPCIIQTVTRRDELNLVASRSVAEDPAFYFKSQRPPLLKDFLDPRIRKILLVRPIVRLIEVSYEIRETEIRDYVHAD